ncbi:uncharacterized protein [Asterias amurensis]|uniref:uncharacterized protein n=1 Tax=Asterias amurensis TaxID=7602 RepID=UPI003AB6AB64
MERCEIKELYRRLQDEECVCYLIEERRETLRKLSSFALWVDGLSKDVKTDPSRWTPKEEREEATGDEINRSEDDQDKQEVASSHLLEKSHTRCFPEGGMAIDQTARPASQSSGSSLCIISHHTQSEELVGKSPIFLERKQGSSSFSSPSRDRLLLCLTVCKELFEVDASCEWVYTLQQEMISRGLLDDLGLLMKSEDRLVAFMTCKMLTAVLPASKKEMVTAVLKGHLLRCLATINACNQSFFLVEQDNPDDSNKINPPKEVNQCQNNQGQVEACQDNLSQVNPIQVDLGQQNNPTHSDSLLNMSRGHDTQIQVNPGQINHAIFTFDLVRLLLIKRSSMDSPHLKVFSSSQRCKRRATPTAGDEQGFQAEVLHLLYTLVPDIVLSFLPAVTATHQGLLAAVISSNKTTSLILASFLDLTHSLFKGGPGEPQWHNFTFKILPLLMNLLKKYNNDLIVLKKLLDILTVSMNQSAEGKTQSIQSQPSMKNLDMQPGEHLVTIATSFVDMIVEDCILDDIPYRSGPVGFGGGDFHSSSGMSGDDAAEGTECGDRTLLRKLCRVTLSSLKILVAHKCEHSEMILNEAEISKCFQTLSMYICGKLNLPLISKPPSWIFNLFAEQDDCLIWVMLCVLNIHRSLHVLEPLYPLLKDQLNPHKIFIGFLETVAYDPSVLLDLLISSETPFLEYLVQYLHTVIRDWEVFYQSHLEVGSVGSGLHLHSEQVTLNENEDDVSDDELVTDNLTVCTSQVSDMTEGNDNSGYGSRIDTELKGSPRPKRMKTDIQRTVTYIDQNRHDTDSNALTMLDKSPDINSSTSPTDSNISQPNKFRDQIEDQISLDVSDHGIKVSNQELEGSLEDVMTTLIRLRFLIERISGRDLFPYPIAPLLRLLERVEDMYDDMGSTSPSADHVGVSTDQASKR